MNEIRNVIFSSRGMLLIGCFLSVVAFVLTIVFLKQYQTGPSVPYTPTRWYVVVSTTCSSHLQIENGPCVVLVEK